MASGTFYSSWAFGEGSYRIRVDWSESDTSVANNTSKVTVKAALVAEWEIGIGSRTVTININGNSGNVTFNGASGTGTYYAPSRSVTVTHDSDGSKNISISVSFPVNATISGHGYIGTMSASKTVTLDKIARTPSAPTSFTITAGFGNYVGLGDTITLKWSGASGNITGYKLQYSRGNSGWKDWKTVTGTSVTDSFTATNIATNGAGNAVKYRVCALNNTLASAWKESNTLTIMGGMDLKVSNAWKTGSVWINVNGTWKRAKRVYINVNGTWKYSI